jgi:hypothetical protein
MCRFVWLAQVRRLASSTRLAVGALAAIAMGSMLLLGASSPAQASAALFASLCSGCHNNVTHPRDLVYNAAGNVSIITAVNALGMGANGSLADHISIATYLDSVKPTITLAPVAHDSPGTEIRLRDIIVSGAQQHADWKMIANIESVSAPTKGTVTYSVANGFAQPSYAIYKPFPGQSGIDTWTYQGSGPGGTTTIRTASVSIATGNDQPVANYQGLWWKSPAGSESGWGINFAHQGDVIFATWFTYDATGKALWLSMTANKLAEGVYAGTFYQTQGPSFSAVPFSPTAVTATEVGTGNLTFSDANSGTFAYVINGIAQTKAITRQVFGALPTCTFGAQSNLAVATNYQDLWWAAPAGVESGWGVNFTHQGDIIFATWFTYDVDGTPLWLSATVNRTGVGVYTGALYRTTGPAFSAVPFLPGEVGLNAVGTLTLTFATGNNASFAYTVALNGPASAVTQTKTIVRQVFRTPGTVCS